MPSHLRSIVLSLCILVGISLFGTAQTYLFNRADFPIGTYPTGIAVGDFNRDGKLDVAIADTEEGSVSILLGKNNGTFAKRIVYMGFNPGAIAVGDFNRDGKLDLAVTNWLSNTVSILPGNGNGTFQTALNFDTSLQPSQIVVGDFNHDGKPDVAITHNAGNSISVLLGNGDGTLQGYVDYPVPNGSIGIVTADFNRDGKLDLAVADGWSDYVCIFLGNGDGTFQPAINVAGGQAPVFLAVGDVNGDGLLDLIVSDGPDCGCGYVSVLLGNGDGSFKAPLTINLIGPGGVIVAGDFNGDHKLDFGVIGSDGYDTVMYMFLGNGDGTFKAAGQYGADSAAETMGLGDFNHDGILDIAVGSFNGNNPSTASVLLGNGDGSFGRFAAYPTGNWPTSIVAADFNGDGRNDIAVFDVFDKNVSVLLNAGNGTFKAGVIYGVGNSGQQGVIAAGDFNGDGKPDLVVTDFFGATVSVLLNLGAGTFGSHTDYAVGGSPVLLAVGDFNGDGKLDLVVGLGTGLAFLAGKGNGSFAAPVAFGSGLYPLSLAAADFNGDGKLDLALINSAMVGNSLLVLVGNGNGTFGTPVSYPVTGSPTAVTAADLNADGKSDLVVGGALVEVLLGNGDGTFQAHKDYALGSSAYTVQAADLSGTGIQDLVVSVSNSYAAQLGVLGGNGNGTFKPYTDYYVGRGIDGVAIADFDKNGTQDVAVTNTYYYQTATVVLSNPVMALYPTAIKFAGQIVGTTSSAKSTIISNPGRVTVKVSSISITGTNSTDFQQTNTCGTSVSGQKTCSVSVTFHPTAKGLRVASLQIKDNALGKIQIVTFSGKGL